MTLQFFARVVELVDTQVSEFKTAMFPVFAVYFPSAFSEEKSNFNCFHLLQEAAQFWNKV